MNCLLSGEVIEEVTSYFFHQIVIVTSNKLQFLQKVTRGNGSTFRIKELYLYFVTFFGNIAIVWWEVKKNV